ncbi:MAG: strawberry notch C-terminal domain-containing protein, partial [Spongiibacteraceae bacterium]|nr:strawberry notch C-terminal domain-containing protein [Spongiibacteraceae bacterium]
KQISANIKIINRDDTMWDIANALRQENEKLAARLDALQKIIDDRYQAEQSLVEQSQGEKRPRVVFLSATPFPYEKTVDYAEEYLFQYEEGEQGGGYNTGSPFDRFMMQHFGYRMRYNKLTEPGPEVNRGLLQRQFNSWLKQNGVLSSRLIDVPHDYDRRFILVESEVGIKIDEGLEYLRENPRMYPVYRIVLNQFDHLSRRFLLEAIKAREVVPEVREHMARGRKVVVFHDFKTGGGFHPFDLSRHLNNGEVALIRNSDGTEESVAIKDLVREFMDTRKDLVGLPLRGLPTPIDTFRNEFGDELVIFNGDISKNDRREAVKKFQDDNSKVKIILVQSAAGREGISLHDTTGKHQRVLFNLGLPTTPATAIQQEGRIYRIGQQSDAIFRYLNTGTAWERIAFANTIARRSSAVENLALGEEARALMDSFIQAFEESDRYPAGMEGEGKGGKERDAAAMAALSEWDRAKTFYFSQQKKTSKTKAKEGTDYFATPEPVGLKMVELADIRGGEEVLEPSAGHGAIARWFPENAGRTVIEPSSELYSRLRMVTDAKAIQEKFEDHNIVNKYDAIVMNPPFGQGGKTAIEHLAKAAKHLRDRGRIVALIPTGPSADKRFDDWMYGANEKGKKADPSSEGVYLVADIRLPQVTFERAGTRVSTRIVVLEKVMDRDEAAMLGGNISRDYSDIQKIGDLFDRLEGLELKPRRRLSQQPGSETISAGSLAPQQRGARQDSAAAGRQDAGGFTLAQTRHAKKGIDLFVASFSARVPREVYDRVNSIAKKHGGYYSSYNKQGAIPGFQFESEADRAAFLAEVNGESVQEERAGYGVDLPQTIDVDGVQRPTRNSNGQLIHPTEEGIRNFWRWFGDSKVVDENGEPVVVYHGTRHDISAFSREKSLSRFYFARDPKVAADYSGFASGANVIPVYLSLQNPLVVEARGALWIHIPLDGVPSEAIDLLAPSDISRGATGTAALSVVAEALGRDGLIVRNVIDSAGPYSDEHPTDVYIAFRPEQIKSATGNRGTFSPGDANILREPEGPIYSGYEREAGNVPSG